MAEDSNAGNGTPDDVETATAAEQAAQNSSNSNAENTPPPKPVLRYPYENQNRYSGKVQFKMKKIIPPVLDGSGEGAIESLKQGAISGAVGVSNTIARAIETGGAAAEAAGALIASGNYDATLESLKNSTSETANAALKWFKDTFEGKQSEIPEALDVYKKNAERKTDYQYDGLMIEIYLPVAFSVSDSMAYDTPSIGNAGAFMMQGLNGGEGLLSSGFDAIASGINSVVDFAMGNQAGTMARLGAVRLANKAPDEIKFGAQASLAVTVNPHIRTLFRNVNLRRFTFQFKFIATSPKEAAEVEKIIKRFRQSAYPESIGGDLGISLGYEYPDLFDISVINNGKVVGNRIKLCHLESINTNYNPSSMGFHADGKPVEIDLSLNFVEEKTLDRADIEAGY